MSNEQPPTSGPSGNGRPADAAPPDPHDDATARWRAGRREAAAAHGRPATLIPCAEHPTAGRELGERFAAEQPLAI